MPRKKRRGLVLSALLLCTGLLGGLLIGLVWSSPPDSGSLQAEEESSRARLIIERLEAEQQALKAELADLRREWTEHGEQAAANSDRLLALNVELDRQRVLAGLIPLKGPGVLVKLDDGSVEVPRGAEPNAYLVHEYDLRDIVNLLWAAGSEGIAINSERIVSRTSIYCVGSTVMVNDTRLSPPYEIRAIGNPRVLRDHLLNPAYLASLKDKQRLFGLVFEVATVSQVMLPGYSGSFLARHARPGE